MYTLSLLNYNIKAKWNEYLVSQTNNFNLKYKRQAFDFFKLKIEDLHLWLDAMMHEKT